MRPLLITIATSALLVGLLGAPSTTAQAAPSIAPQGLGLMPVTARISGGLERDVIALTNRARARHGCAPLRHSLALRTAARRHSQTMARHGQMSHRLPGEPGLVARVTGAGYRGADLIGENVAAGFRTAAGVVRAWMASPSHRANILTCRFRDIGVGVVIADGRRWWTQNFGRR